MTTELPRIDSEGLRMAAEEGHQRVSSVASINKGERSAEEVAREIEPGLCGRRRECDIYQHRCGDCPEAKREKIKAALTEARAEIERLEDRAGKLFALNVAAESRLTAMQAALEESELSHLVCGEARDGANLLARIEVNIEDFALAVMGMAARAHFTTKRKGEQDRGSNGSEG